jgi:predicted extracellular nuclease
MLPFRPSLLLALLSNAALFAQTPICTIQGSGTASALEGQVVTTTGTVTAVFLGSGALGGYFIEDPLCDANANTSNGLFVYQPAASGVAVGQRIQVTGEVDEFQGLTEIKNVTSVVQLGSGTVVPTNITLPFLSLAERERYEGMLLRFPGALVVTDNSDWVQYGEVSLAPARLFQPTHAIDPNDANASGTSSTGSSNVTAITALAALNTRSEIRLDDGRTTAFPAPLPLVGPDGTLRTGSTITDLTAVLTYTFSDYRLEPVGAVSMAHAPRPSVPDVGGDLRLVGLNVLNYWTTLGEWGAANAGELQRQRTKLVAALQAMNADALVLCELENNDAAWADLLGALNAAIGAGTYACLEEDAAGGGTRTVLFYKPAVLAPVTQLYSLYTAAFQRPHLTQGFQVNATGARFLLSSVHLRSKLCDNATGANTDQGDGQSCFNALRRTQAQELAAHWSLVRQQTDIAAHLMLGDLNAYTEEDPLDVLRASGLQRLLGANAHSYKFGSAFGALDHAFGTGAMAQAVAGAEVWHINSDEPAAFSYADANISRYQPNAYRYSDHDPVVVGVHASQLTVGLSEMAGSPAVLMRMASDGNEVDWTVGPEVHGALNVTLTDVAGRMLATASGHGNTLRLPLEAVPSGMYLWRIGSGSTVLGQGRLLRP